eukprot:TRINITY_DN11340_c0_g1_i1.p1 TRINITY_DN11340_c0_g1~~TRINITY_DN11340_c0_g1_i1.p1  ORF type:complete len:444 (-),score=38.42 TRINITY_DN11340_c0_g1_i1:73-1224(-)
MEEVTEHRQNPTVSQAPTQENQTHTDSRYSHTSTQRLTQVPKQTEGEKKIPCSPMGRWADLWERNVKFICLLLMVLQTTSLVILLRYSRTQEGDRYFSSTTVAVGELIKSVTCVIVLFWQDTDAGHSIYKHLVQDKMDLLKVSVPSILYAVQNNLLFYALSNLSVPHYQVMYQLKVFTTALFSVALLAKKLTLVKWFALILLFLGVCVIQLDLNANSSSSEKEGGDSLGGSVAVLAATITSGFAGVYFEKILKQTPVSLWIRNLQLGVLGMISSFTIVFASDREELFGPGGKGFFFGWNWLVVVVVFNQALGGFLVALVVKYADNILKGFAVSFSIILSSILSILFFDFSVSLYFLLGTALVLMSVYVYQRPTPAVITNLPPV